MNHAYRLVFNRALNAWVAVAEIAKSHSKGGKAAAIVAPLAAAFAFTASPAWALDANALPDNGRITLGDGSIGTAGNAMTVRQATQNLSISWDSFNIGRDASVTVIQPSSSAILFNRVLGSDPSQIYGKLNANGQVFLSNPNGILFGKTAEVNVGGLVATTLNLSDDGFAKRKFHFSGKAGSVRNEGSIKAADGGYVALLGGQIVNQGVLAARLGNVSLAAGSDVTLDFAGDGLMSVQVNQGALHALAENKQLIQADGGTVLLTAKAADRLIAAVVNNEGVIEARGVEKRGGAIALLGDMEAGEVHAAGVLDTSPLDATAPAGFVETSAAKVSLDAGLTVKTGGGRWLIDPVDITIDDAKASAIQTALGSGDVTVSTANSATNVWGTNGNGTDAGDITVNSAINWSSHILTLRADHNIVINRSLTATNTAGLALHYGQGAMADGNTAAYTVNAPINLASTGSFQTKLGSNGNVVNYVIVTSLGSETSSSDGTLQGMRGDLGGNYVLGADIDASATQTWNSGAGFTPVGWLSGPNAFSGAFLGGRHAISNLHINRPANDYIGLFGSLSGVVRDVALIGASVTGNGGVGALVGQNSGMVSGSYATGSVSGGNQPGLSGIGGLVGQSSGTVSRSYAMVDVSGDTFVGGLMGYNGGTISQSYASGSVSGGNSVGGLVGSNTGGTISQSYAVSSVSGISAVGGLVGSNVAGTILESYATGSVSGSSAVGGLVGIDMMMATVQNSYWDTETTGQTSGVGTQAGDVFNATGLTTAEMRWSSNFTGWSFATVPGNGDWFMIESSTRPFLASEYSTTISNTHQLQLMAMDLSANYTLAKDIDFGTTFSGSSRSNIWTTSATAGAGFAPIGKWDTRYTGTFDGAGHAVSNLYINRGNFYTPYVGLFGIVGTGGTVRDVRLLDAKVSGYVAVGGLVGWNEGSVSGSSASGSVSGAAFVGGLVGLNDGGVRDSYAAGSVSASSSAAGGLVGSSANDADVVNSRYDIDNVLINGAHAATLGGLYSAQYQDWLAHGKSLNIADYSASLVPDAQARNVFTVSSVQGMKDLLGFADNANYTFRLGGDLNLTGASGYSIPYFAGAFDGAGHVLSNLNIDQSHYGVQVGFIGHLASGATVTQLGISSGSVTGVSEVGALVGENQGTVSESYSAATVSGGGEVGGLVGRNNFGRVSQSHATGDVSGSSSVGGLIGSSWGTVSQSYATGRVSGNQFVGGLIGLNYSAVSYSYATGQVTGSQFVGGLTGFNVVSVSESYATGQVSGSQNVGGLTGGNFGTVDQSYATGSVLANTPNSNSLGGLVGNNASYGTVSQSYATGSVTGIGDGDATVSSMLGGLIGQNNGAVSESYATGRVSGDVAVGGLVGFHGATASVQSSYWDIQTSGQSAGYGANSDGSFSATGLTTAQMKQQASFTGFDFDTVWRIYEGLSYPVLQALQQTVTVTAADASKTYDKTAWSGGNGYTVVNPSGVNLTGTVSYTGDSQGAVDAGSYTIAPGGVALNYQTQADYQKANLRMVNGTLTIDPRTLNVSYTGVSKPYDGGTAATVTTSDDRVSGDALTIVRSAEFSDKNAGVEKTVTVSDVSLSGASAGNYVLASTSGSTTANIERKQVSISGLTADNKTYDGSTAAVISNWGSVSTGVEGESLTLNHGTASYASAGAGVEKTVTASGYSLANGTGGSASNYMLTSTSATTTANIDRKTLELAHLKAEDKTFDGNTSARISADLGGVVSGDVVNAAVSASFADSNIGQDKLVTVTAVALSGRDAANYRLPSSRTTRASITTDEKYRTTVTDTQTRMQPKPVSTQETPTGGGAGRLQLIQIISSGIALPDGLSD